MTVRPQCRNDIGRFLLLTEESLDQGSASGRRFSASRRACCRRAVGSVSQIRTVLSPDPENQTCPSGLNASVKM